MRLFLILLTLVSLAPAPAAAQRFVRAREPATGELATGDSALANGALYDTWYFRAEPGHAYAIYLSTDFEAQLAVGPGVGPACEGDCARGEDGRNGRFSAELFFIPERQGLYPIRVGAARAGQTGEYELLLEEGELPGADADTIEPEPRTPAELADAAAAWAARPQNLFSGTPATGTLGTSRRNAHGEHYDEWAYYVPAGETVTLTLMSDEFDAVLRIVGRGMEGDEELAWDDDAGDGTNSTLTFTHPRDGVYTVQAAGKGGATGRYTILASNHGDVQSDTFAAPPAGATEDAVPVLEDDTTPPPAMPIRAGEQVRGELTPWDRQGPDYVSFDPWTYQARAGETVTLRMIADEYPSQLQVGRWVDGEWQELTRTPDDWPHAETERTFTFPDDGEYEIRARGSMGGYVLAVERP